SSAEQAAQDIPAASAGPQELASEDLDWLAGLGGPVSAGQPAAGLPAEAAAPAAAEAQPDWLKEMGSSIPEDQAAEVQSPPAESTPAGNQPDWLQDLGRIQEAVAATLEAAEP